MSIFFFCEQIIFSCIFFQKQLFLLAFFEMLEYPYNNNVLADGLEKLSDLKIYLTGSFAKFLDENCVLALKKSLDLNDNDIYLWAQLPKDEKTCFWITANDEYILVCEYGENWENPKIVMFKRR